MLTLGAAALAVSEAVKDLLARRSFVRALNKSVASSSASSTSSVAVAGGSGVTGATASGRGVSSGQSICARLRSAMAARQAAAGASSTLQISPCVNPSLAWREEIVTALGDFEVASVFPTPVVNLASFTSFIDTPSDLTQCLRGRHPLLIEAESTDSQEYWEQHYAAAAAAASTAAPALPSSQNALESSGGLCKLERHSRRLAWRAGPVFAFLVTCTELELRQVFDAFLTNRLVADDPLKFNLLLLVTLEGLPMNLIGGTVSEPSSPTSSTATEGGFGFRGDLQQRELRDFRDRRCSEPAVPVRRLVGGSRARCRLLQDISEIGAGGGGSSGSVEDLLASASSLLRRTDSQSSQLSGGRQNPSVGNPPSSGSQAKPPNLAILTDPEGDAVEPASSLTAALRSLTDPFDTIVRCLDRRELLRSDAAWTTACRVLVLPSPLTSQEAATVAKRFLAEAGGCLIALVDNPAELGEDSLGAALPGVEVASVAVGAGDEWSGYQLGDSEGKVCLLVWPCSDASPGSSSSALSSVLKLAGVRTIEPGSCQLPKLQPVYFVSLDGQPLDSILPVSGSANSELIAYQPNRHLLVRPPPQEAASVATSADGGLTIPLVSLDYASLPAEFRVGDDFDLRQFSQYREAKVLGGSLMYSPVMESSWDVITGLLSRLPPDSGLLIVSGVQLKGRGRDQNVWLAPPGSAQLSVHISLPTSCPLASKPSLLQHVAALAVLKALRSVPGCGDLDVKIKWPNDIHIPGRGKVAGILVKASSSGNYFSAAIGIGINVTNRSPGTCVAAAFDQSGHPPPPTLTREVVIARVVSELESLVSDFSFEAFRKLYIDNWMHSDQIVDARLSGASSTDCVTVACRIVGIDEAGFLRVRDLKSGRCLSLHPDGNSFDMTRSLLVPK